MKYRLEGMVVEAIDTYVRITLGNGQVAVTKKECPKSIEVAQLLTEMQGFWPNPTQLQNCSRAARDARDNKEASELCLKG